MIAEILCTVAGPEAPVRRLPDRIEAAGNMSTLPLVWVIFFFGRARTIQKPSGQRVRQLGWFDRFTRWWRSDAPETVPQRRIVVVSDLHLGEEVGGGDAPYVELIEALNHSFSTFIDHLTASSDPVTLVIDGDCIDFLRTTVQPNPIEARLLNTRPLSAREARLGLDSSRTHAVWKLSQVVGFHRPIFQAMARFVDASHHLVIIRGNHDIELYWPEVRTGIVEVLASMTETSSEEIADRIRFEPWFHYQPGLAYIEHGHQYDPHCSYEDLLDPVEDEGRLLALPYTQWTIRYFAPLLHGSRAAEMEEWSFFQFLTWAVTLPPAKTLTALVMFNRLVIDILARRSWRTTVGRPRIKARHKRRLGKVAREADLPLAVVERLDALKEVPVQKKFLGITLAFYLDRFVLMGGLGLGMLASIALPSTLQGKFGAALATLLGAICCHELLRRLRTRDATPRLEEKALDIARILDVPYVVFGHSHRAGIHGTTDTTSGAAGPHHHYVNTGHWVARYPETANTYAEIVGDADGARVRLLRWRGPDVDPQLLGYAPESRPQPQT